MPKNSKRENGDTPYILIVLISSSVLDECLRIVKERGLYAVRSHCPNSKSVVNELLRTVKERKGTRYTF